MSLFRKWEVVDSRGNVEGEFWFRKNADLFAGAMNIWSTVYFGNMVFSVRQK